MIIVFAILFLLGFLWLNKCLDAFIHAKEKSKYEMWEEEKMVACSIHT